MESHYSFLLSIIDEAGAVVHREEVQDFLPCFEDLLYSAVCTGKVPNDGKLPPASVVPVWRDGEGGEVAGVTVSLPPLSKRYGLVIFSDSVRQVERDLVKDGGEGGKKFTWRVEAKEREEERKGKLRISLTRQPYPIVRRSLSDFGIEKGASGNNPFSLFISRSLIDELREETGRSLDTERADILSGYLVQEAEGGVGLVVMGRTPALAETASSRVHFAFSPLTFLAAQREIGMQPNGETIVGWAHNHPPPCGGNCLKFIPPCNASTVFFSAADRSVHRASFPAPYMIALVSGKGADKRADDPEVKIFGWEDGVIREKEFSVFLR